MSVYALQMYLYIHRHPYMDVHIYIGAHTYNVHTDIYNIYEHRFS